MTGRISRSVAWRLTAVVLPSVVAMILVAGLFYYGEFGRAAPRLTLIVAAALTLVSVAMAWLNAMYFADRLSRLARVTGQDRGITGRTDEFDRIERAVGNLGSALSAAEQEKARSDAIAAARLHDQATMLAGVVSDSIAQLDQVRLPLQILLESPFGELNENQEELLRDARAAADAIDTALRRLGQVADIDRDAFVSQEELVQVNDVVRSVLPLARAAADRHGARTETELEPGLPRVVADRARLAEALSLFVTDASRAAGPDTPLHIATMRDGGAGAFIRIAPVRTAGQSTSGDAAGGAAGGAAGDAGGSSTEPPRLGGTSSFLVASRLVGAQGGEVAIERDQLTLRVGRR